MASWNETFFEITAYILETVDKHGTIANYYQMIGGRAMLYDVATELTDEFEHEHQLKNWDGEFRDVLYEWMALKDKSKQN